MRNLFMCAEPSADISYLSTRTPEHEGARRSRADCDDLWRDFEPYATDHFLAEFPFRFHQRWFEMYLAVSLLRSGLDIQCPKGSAPDVRLKIDNRTVWVEATAPSGGGPENPDRVVQPAARDEHGAPVAFRVPTEKVILRVRGALHDKAQKIEEYRRAGIIGEQVQAVIAINLHDIPHGFYDPEKYALGTVYGQGDQYVVFDRDSGAVVHQGYQHRPTLVRSSGAQVNAAPFLKPGMEHVSAALISAVDAANCPQRAGFDFLILPNPTASPAYTESQIRLGMEWTLRPGADPDSYAAFTIEHQRRDAENPLP
jgi:hypothetical protein